jgi:hypothetical protein
MEDTTTQPDNTEQNIGDTSTVNDGNSDKLFTQDEVNKIVAKRVKEVKKTYANYDELKKVAEDAKDKLEDLKEQKKEVEIKYLESSFNSALDHAAREVNLDAELASYLLDKSKLIYDEDKPTNIKELLQVVIEKHPQLVKKAIVTPEVLNTIDPQKQQFSLRKTNNGDKFFAGSGLRLNSKTGN